MSFSESSRRSRPSISPKNSFVFAGVEDPAQIHGHQSVTPRRSGLSHGRNILNENLDQENRVASSNQSLSTHKDSFANKNSAEKKGNTLRHARRSSLSHNNSFLIEESNTQANQVNMASHDDSIYSEMDAEMFIKYLKDLDPHRFLPLPINIQ
jgi:hypothetical protein